MFRRSLPNDIGQSRANMLAILQRFLAAVRRDDDI